MAIEGMARHQGRENLIERCKSWSYDSRFTLWYCCFEGIRGKFRSNQKSNGGDFYDDKNIMKDCYEELIF